MAITARQFLYLLLPIPKGQDCNHQMSLRFLNLLSLSLLIITNFCPTRAADLVGVPCVFGSEDVLTQRTTIEEQRHDVELIGTASGFSNVGAIQQIDKNGQRSRTFGAGKAYAVLETAWRLTIRHRDGWWIEYGQGMRDSYKGNSDAAQLWIDLHSDGPSRASYYPEATSKRIDIRWYGLGKKLPLRMGNTRGECRILFRDIVVDDYFSRVLAGQVEASDFSGLMKVVSAHRGGAGVTGKGWTVDVQTWLYLGNQWLGYIALEGLIGSITWHGITVEKGFILSPRVFVDRDGFLHDIGGGITGMQWREDITLRPHRTYCVELLQTSRSGILLGIEHKEGVGTTASLGLAWTQRNHSVSYVRLYPSQGRVKFGVAGSSWQFSISGDDWLFSSPSHATITLSVRPFRF